MTLRDPAILERSLADPERRVLRALCGKIRAHYGERLLRLTLFGSRARGDVTEDSDIDLLVLLDVPLADEGTETEVIWSFAAEAKKSEKGFYVPIAPLVMARQRYVELQALGRRLCADVDREGIPL